MTSCELAKELKDGGFPNIKDHFPGYVEGTNAEIDMFLKNHPRIEMPTLSELIEACGEGFDFLARNRDGNWQASGKTEKDFVLATPEEAVARLWLALNKKS